MTDTITQKVAAKIAELVLTIESRAVDIIAEKENAKTVDIVVQAVGELDKLEKERGKLRPAFAGYDDDGNGIGERVWTKLQVDQRAKLSGKIKKISDAIAKAATGDRDAVAQLPKLIKGEGGGNEKPEADTE